MPEKWDTKGSTRASVANEDSVNEEELNSQLNNGQNNNGGCCSCVVL